MIRIKGFNSEKRQSEEQGENQYNDVVYTHKHKHSKYTGIISIWPSLVIMVKPGIRDMCRESKRETVVTSIS